MKKTVFVLFSLIAFTSLMAKKSTFSVSFGSGGGVTGLITTYTLNSDRTFSKEESIGHKKEQLAKVKAKDVTEVRKLLAAVNFSVLNINQTGNMTYFINVTQDGKESKSRWTGGKPDNQGLDALNTKLNSLIPHK